MKRLTLIMMAAMLVAGCGGATHEQKQEGTRKAEQAAGRVVVLRYFRACAAGDGETVAACYKAPAPGKQLVAAMAPQAKLMIEFRRKMIAAYGPKSLGDLAPVIKDPVEVEKVLKVTIKGEAGMADVGYGSTLRLVKDGDAWLLFDPALMRLSAAQVAMAARSAPAIEQAVREATALIGKPGQTAQSVVNAFKEGQMRVLENVAAGQKATFEAQTSPAAPANPAQ
ncbi:MAG: hypothetical protein HN370_09110 [Phycisphaerales bacterium]|jgi:hypothetical protein|nr:hypothetical protein [Phycisphaerales bacterium]